METRRFRTRSRINRTPAAAWSRADREQGVTGPLGAARRLTVRLGTNARRLSQRLPTRNRRFAIVKIRRLKCDSGGTEDCLSFAPSEKEAVKRIVCRANRIVVCSLDQKPFGLGGSIWRSGWCGQVSNQNRPSSGATIPARCFYSWIQVGLASSLSALAYLDPIARLSA